MPFWVKILIQAVDIVEAQPGKAGSAGASERCGNAFCNETHAKDDLKNGWTKWELNDGSGFKWLCGPCSAAYQEGQFCIYCEQIYRDASAKCSLLDGKDWMECEDCGRWVHVDCVAHIGEQAKIKDLLQAADFKYCCPNCLLAKKSSKKKERRLAPKGSKARRTPKRKSSISDHNTAEEGMILG